MDDLNPFVASEKMILDSQVGDLVGDGSVGVVLVLAMRTVPTAPTAEAAPRETLLLLRDGEGALRKHASNPHVVPGPAYGGLAGDPYASTHIEPGHFTITTRGGSREQWRDEFMFAYSTDHNSWFLTRVSRYVEDRETGDHHQIELSIDDFGNVAFADFDPAQLPEANST
jgi:hypothetical protein